MKKGAVIVLSITTLLLVAAGILFGAVFCLRYQSVKVVGDSPITISKEDIISTAGLKEGQSIFLLDKEKAINNIEAKFPFIKVIQVKTTGLTEIEFIVRARHKMFYSETASKYYIMDEELKVLDILEKSAESSSDEVSKLILINSNNFSIDSSTLVCDFVGTDEQREATYNLYQAMINAVTKNDVEDIAYINRDDVKNEIRQIEFKSHSTFNTIIITTKYGVKLDIENPQNDMANKINICYIAISQYLSSEEAIEQSKVTKGTIKIYLDLENKQNIIYIPEIETELE